MPLSAPTAPTFCTPIDDAGTTVAAPYSPGDATLVVVNGAAFGTPTPTNPVRLTCTRPNSNPALPGTPLQNLRATGRSGNTLTGVAVMDGKSDVPLVVGDEVEILDTAGMVADIHAAIASAYALLSSLVGAVNAAALDSAAVHITGNETIAGTKTFSIPIAGSITGNAATATVAAGLSAPIAESQVTGLTSDLLSLGSAIATNAGAIATNAANIATNTSSIAVNTSAIATKAPAAGSNSIVTLGTVATGTWQGTAIAAAYLGSHAHSAADVTSGTLAVARGGTGLTTVASGKLLYASATDTLAALTLGTGLSITSGTLNAAGGSGASTSAANTWTAQQIFETGASGGSPSVFRQTGGTPGTHEVQVYHDGTNGYFKAASGITRLVSAGTGYTGSNAVELYEAGAGSPGLRLVGDAVTINQIGDRSGNWVHSVSQLYFYNNSYTISWSDVGLARPAPNVLKVTDGSTGVGDILLRTPIIRRTSAPADADLVAGDLCLWFDDTNGAAKAMFKGKTANGTVVGTAINLT